MTREIRIDLTDAVPIVWVDGVITKTELSVVYLQGMGVPPLTVESVQLKVIKP